MGRELQKKKNRSSVAKVKHKPKSKKKLLHNPIVAAEWNQKETLSQNYRRLGLASRLNDRAGGTEKTSGDVELQEAGLSIQNPSGIKSKLPTKIDVSEVRIERDPKTGAILRVLDGESRKPNPLHDPLNDLDDSEDEGWNGFVNEHGLLDSAQPGKSGQTSVVKKLEEEASRPAERRVRKQSDREAQWVADLVEKYGDDYGKMSRDMKMNPNQQSVGDIRKRITKWRAAQEDE